MLNLNYLSNYKFSSKTQLVSTSGTNMKNFLPAYFNQDNTSETSGQIKVDNMLPFGTFYPINTQTQPTAFIPDYIMSGTIKYNKNTFDLHSFTGNETISSYLFINFTQLKGITNRVTLSSDNNIFYTVSNNLLIPTNEITVDNGDAIFKLWQKRTGLVYTKMNQIWNELKSTQQYTKKEEKFTSIQLVKAVSAQTKLQKIQYAIVTNSTTILNFPYNLIDAYGYNVNDLINDNLNYVANAFVSKITGKVTSLFNF